MIAFTKYFYLVFGLLVIIGGLIGYLRKKSTASLVAGGACGAFMLVASFLLPGHLNPALIIGLSVSVAMLGQFLPKALHGEIKPHILLSVIFAAASLVVTLLAWYKR
jgi:uncharacterized membrane protein (UPF0136 family)